VVDRADQELVGTAGGFVGGAFDDGCPPGPVLDRSDEAERAELAGPQGLGSAVRAIAQRGARGPDPTPGRFPDVTCGGWQHRVGVIGAFPGDDESLPDRIRHDSGVL
jgi:hypothetical protein